MLVARARKVVLGEEPSTSISIPEFDRVDTFDVSSLAERIAACGLGPVVAVSVGSDSEHKVECVRTVLMGAHQLAIAR
jgi:hypothetical protein